MSKYKDTKVQIDRQKYTKTITQNNYTNVYTEWRQCGTCVTNDQMQIHTQPQIQQIQKHKYNKYRNTNTTN